MACGKGGKPCRPPRAGDSIEDHHHQHHPRASDVLSRGQAADVKGSIHPHHYQQQVASPQGSAALDGDMLSHHRHHHPHHRTRSASLSGAVKQLPTPSVQHPASDGEECGDHPRRHSQDERGGSSASHHHHHGSLVASTAECAHGGHNAFAHAKGQASGQTTLHEDEARQHSVVVAASLTSNVLPLSQGLVCPVVVAAGAADLSHGPGHPQQRDKRHNGSVAERSSKSPTTSPSAAAAPLSVSRAHT